MAARYPKPPREHVRAPVARLGARPRPARRRAAHAPRPEGGHTDAPRPHTPAAQGTGPHPRSRAQALGRLRPGAARTRGRWSACARDLGGTRSWPGVQPRARPCSPALPLTITPLPGSPARSSRHPPRATAPPRHRAPAPPPRPLGPPRLPATASPRHHATAPPWPPAPPRHRVTTPPRHRATFAPRASPSPRHRAPAPPRHLRPPCLPRATAPPPPPPPRALPRSLRPPPVPSASPCLLPRPLGVLPASSPVPSAFSPRRPTLRHAP
ncbi:hypothetical protein HNP84_003619 [Thermocatellispora tengchongensis]|uniref:Uncharacterized protein n=1 Tax=Thermocatellispora tengchongensis TaxID=1073253 RepID=A0A840P7J8_9ACTN|nr:hypothetical protein [Thermocatellispora tengchongensis]